MKKSVLAPALLAFNAGSAVQLSTSVLAGPADDVQAAMVSPSRKQRLWVRLP